MSTVFVRRRGSLARPGELSSLTPFHLPKHVRLESLTYAPRARTAGDRVMTTATKNALVPQLVTPP
jgi:hypothetical protein